MDYYSAAESADLEDFHDYGGAYFDSEGAIHDLDDFYDEDDYECPMDTYTVSPLTKLDKKHGSPAKANEALADVFDFLWHSLYTPQDEYYLEYPKDDEMLDALQLVLKKMKYVRSDETLYDAHREKGRIDLLLAVVKACKGSGLKKSKLKKSIKGLLRDSEKEQKADQVASKQNIRMN